MKSKLGAALVISFMSLSAWGQLVSQPISDNSRVVGSGSGQSFTAPATTQIHLIRIRPNTPFNGTLFIYNGSVGSGVLSSPGTAAYTQTGISLAASANNGPMREIVLTTPFPISAGNTYTFIFDSGDFYFNSNDPYPGGRLITDYADTSLPAFDLAFEILGPGTSQATTFNSVAPSGAKVGDSYTVAATGGGSGIAVLFVIDPSASSVCTITGSTVTMTGVGTCVINANQSGNATYDPAPQVQQSFAVAAAAAPLPTTPASIPTLSQWGVILMSAALGLFAAWRVRRQA